MNPALIKVIAEQIRTISMTQILESHVLNGREMIVSKKQYKTLMFMTKYGNNKPVYKNTLTLKQFLKRSK